MYFKQSYAISQAQSPLRKVRWMNIQQNTLLCYLLFCIIGTLISIFVIYFIRYRNIISSLLSYPDFVCSLRSCYYPNYNHEKSFITRIIREKEALPFTYP